MQDDFDTLWQNQVGDVDRVAGRQVLQVDFDKGRQITGQAAQFDIRHHVLHDTAAELDAGGDVSIDEVQRHLLVQFVRSIHTLKVSMQNNLTIGMTLYVT